MFFKKANKEKNKKAKKGTSKLTIFSFFTKWFFVGIILVLISILLHEYVDQITKEDALYFLRHVFRIIADILTTVGIALFVGCVFDFSKNSEAFIVFVSDILSDIVVSKKFLSTLGATDKKQALNLILKPMDYQIEEYANINSFFKKKIDEATTMFDVNFKTNVVLNVLAYKDKQENKVYCETTLTYTVYKMKNEFAPIKAYYEKEGTKNIDLKIISSTGEVNAVTEEATKKTDAGIEYTILTYNIPPEYNKYDHLMVKRVIREPGEDHWINYIWQSITPYEGVNCKIRCIDGLTIKSHMIFDNKGYYLTDFSKDKTCLDITSSQWLDGDTGFSIIISE